jgi:hypothetical protein
MIMTTKSPIKLATSGLAEQPNKAQSFGREFQTDDGRRITIARSGVSFIRDMADGEVLIGLRNSRPVSVSEHYDTVKTWWEAPPAKFKPVGGTR